MIGVGVRSWYACTSNASPAELPWKGPVGSEVNVFTLRLSNFLLLHYIAKASLFRNILYVFVRRHKLLQYLLQLLKLTICLKNT